MKCRCKMELQSPQGALLNIQVGPTVSIGTRCFIGLVGGHEVLMCLDKNLDDHNRVRFLVKDLGPVETMIGGGRRQNTQNVFDKLWNQVLGEHEVFYDPIKNTVHHGNEDLSLTLISGQSVEVEPLDMGDEEKAFSAVLIDENKKKKTNWKKKALSGAILALFAVAAGMHNASGLAQAIVPEPTMPLNTAISLVDAVVPNIPTTTLPACFGCNAVTEPQQQVFKILKPTDTVCSAGSIASVKAKPAFKSDGFVVPTWFKKQGTTPATKLEISTPSLPSVKQISGGPQAKLTISRPMETSFWGHDLTLQRLENTWTLSNVLRETCANAQLVTGNEISLSDNHVIPLKVCSIPSPLPHLLENVAKRIDNVLDKYNVSVPSSNSPAVTHGAQLEGDSLIPSALANLVDAVADKNAIQAEMMVDVVHSLVTPIATSNRTLADIQIWANAQKAANAEPPLIGVADTHYDQVIKSITNDKDWVTLKSPSFIEQFKDTFGPPLSATSEVFVNGATYARAHLTAANMADGFKRYGETCNEIIMTTALTKDKTTQRIVIDGVAAIMQESLRLLHTSLDPLALSGSKSLVKSAMTPESRLILGDALTTGMTIVENARMLLNDASGIDALMAQLESDVSTLIGASKWLANEAQESIHPHVEHLIPAISSILEDATSIQSIPAQYVPLGRIVDVCTSANNCIRQIVDKHVFDQIVTRNICSRTWLNPEKCISFLGIKMDLMTHASECLKEWTQSVTPPNALEKVRELVHKVDSVPSNVSPAWKLVMDDDKCDLNPPPVIVAADPTISSPPSNMLACPSHHVHAPVFGLHNLGNKVIYPNGIVTELGPTDRPPLIPLDTMETLINNIASVKTIKANDRLDMMTRVMTDHLLRKHGYTYDADYARLCSTPEGCPIQIEEELKFVRTKLVSDQCRKNMAGVVKELIEEQKNEGSAIMGEYLKGFKSYLFGGVKETATKLASGDLSTWSSLGHVATLLAPPALYGQIENVGATNYQANYAEMAQVVTGAVPIIAPVASQLGSKGLAAAAMAGKQGLVMGAQKVLNNVEDAENIMQRIADSSQLYNIIRIMTE